MELSGTNMLNKEVGQSDQLVDLGPGGQLLKLKVSFTPQHWKGHIVFEGEI